MRRLISDVTETGLEGTAYKERTCGQIVEVFDGCKNFETVVIGVSGDDFREVGYSTE